MESFDEMLVELYNNLNQSNEVFKISLPEPVIIKNGSNIIWKNVKEFLRITRRPPDHFVNFLRKESNCVINWISESKSDGLTFSQKKLKSDFLIDHKLQKPTYQ